MFVVENISRLIFIGKAHRQKKFFGENFPIYGSFDSYCHVRVTSGRKAEVEQGWTPREFIWANNLPVHFHWATYSTSSLQPAW